jgi:hypothetical protein
LRNAFIDCAKKGLLPEVLPRLENDDIGFSELDWPTWAHDAQLPPDLRRPPAHWSAWLVLGGRGSGKTRAGAEWVRMAIRLRPRQAAPLRIAIVGPSYAEAREVMVDGVSGLLSLDWSSGEPQFISSRRLLVWPDGSEAQLFSAEDPEQLRGPQFDLAWCDGTLPLPVRPTRQRTGCFSAALHWATRTALPRSTACARTGPRCPSSQGFQGSDRLFAGVHHRFMWHAPWCGLPRWDVEYDCLEENLACRIGACATGYCAGNCNRFEQFRRRGCCRECNRRPGSGRAASWWRFPRQGPHRFRSEMVQRRRFRPCKLLTGNVTEDSICGCW